MSYAEWALLSLMIISWIIATWGFVRFLCILAWYHFPSSTLYPHCKTLKSCHNELLKNRYWGILFKSQNYLGLWGDTLILAPVYWGGVLILWGIIGLTVIIGKNLDVWILSTIAAITLGLFSGFVMAWTILLVWVVRPEKQASRNLMGVISVLISSISLLINIVGPEEVRGFFFKMQNTFSPDTSVLHPSTVARFFGTMIGVLVVVNIVLLFFAGYRIGKIRESIRPR